MQPTTYINIYRVLCKEPFADFFGLSWKWLGVGDVVVGDGREELLLVLAIEGRLTDEHLVEKDTEGPPVDGLAVRLVVDNLGCNVVRRSTKSLKRFYEFLQSVSRIWAS